MRYLVLVLFSAACSSPSTHVNAYSLEVCTPNGSYTPKVKKNTNDKCQGTSNGDNCDDLSSGKVDCIGDGNSGQGDDKKHNCMFPQPGCDENGCCDEDVVDPDAGDDPTGPDGTPDPGSPDGGGGDGSGDDGGGGTSEPTPTTPTDPGPLT
ncbi:MAG: hypothetical protein H0T89_09585 [Deltaproteobacteria bacterium]|nr:hypothetical protein [Deltaproteobacteria bacterium]